jgi:Na+-driven multidrug efflux pump
MSTAGSSMIGQNLGAGKYERVPRIVRSILVCTLAFTMLLSLITAVFPRQVFGLFNSEEEILQAAMAYIPAAVLTFLAAGVRTPCMGLINGSGHSRLNLAVALLDGIVARIGLALLLGIALEMGVEGFWYGNASAGFVPALIGVVFIVSGRWKTPPKAVRKTN